MASYDVASDAYPALPAGDTNLWRAVHMPTSILQQMLVQVRPGRRCPPMSSTRIFNRCCLSTTALNPDNFRVCPLEMVMAEGVG